MCTYFISSYIFIEWKEGSIYTFNHFSGQDMIHQTKTYWRKSCDLA